ncbi:hypothetical protein B4168_0166 [Anoxybacillus flavithermus]|nr:hypothetical protein B4168_0166 [Anoxybacillus flavithermus]OAO88912.1 hypothetical protein GT23_0152 [Parageobacillus thermoglucosidasius]
MHGNVCVIGLVLSPSCFFIKKSHTLGNAKKMLYDKTIKAKKKG